MLLVLAGGVLALLGVAGLDEGGGFWFVLALICVLQAAYPTPVGWAFVVAIYFVISVIYLYAIAADLFELARGHDAHILLNPSDTFFFVCLLLTSLAIAIAVVLHRPKTVARHQR